MEEKKAKKIAFFNDLNELDESDDESEDKSGIDLILRHSKAPSRSLPTQHPSQPLRLSCPLGRTISAPLPNSSSHAPNEVNIIQDGPGPSPVPIINSALHNQVTVDGHKMSDDGVVTASTKALSKAKGKRKRGRSVEPVPESQQIFKGLTLCMTSTLVRPLRGTLRGEM